MRARRRADAAGGRRRRRDPPADPALLARCWSPVASAPWLLGYAGRWSTAWSAAASPAPRCSWLAVARLSRARRRGARCRGRAQPVRLFDPLSVRRSSPSCWSKRWSRRCGGRHERGMRPWTTPEQRRHRAHRGSRSAAAARARSPSRSRSACWSSCSSPSPSSSGPARAEPAAVRDRTMTRSTSDAQARESPRHRGGGRVRRRRRADGRRVLRRGAALPLVLPRHRLRRHAAGRDRRARASYSTATITVRFDANVAGGLPLAVRAGADRDRGPASARSSPSTTPSPISRRAPTTGQAAFNVTPLDRRRLLQQDQLLLLHRADARPGEKREMPVVFFVDPAIAKDPEQ